MSFAKQWDETTPKGTDYHSSVDDHIIDLKVAIRERANVQHHAYSDESGHSDVWEHKPGECTVLYVGNKADFPTPSTSNSGCLAVATDENNALYYWNGSAWTSLNLFSFRSGDILLSSNTNTPSGWTDVSTTYGNKFIRISSGTPLDTGGSDSHDHGGSTGSHQLTESELPKHRHKCGSLKNASNEYYFCDLHGYSNEGTGKCMQVTATDNTDRIACYTSYIGSDQGHSHTLASANNVPVYVQLRMYKKD